MKKVVIALVIVMLMSWLVATGIIYYVGFTGGGWKNLVHEYDIDQKKSVSSIGVSEVEVDVDSTNVDILYADNDEITIELVGKLYSGIQKKIPEIQTNQNNGKLLISTFFPDTSFNFVFFDNTQLTVSVPKNKLNILKVKTVSGEINSSVNMPEMEYYSTSGEISLENGEKNGIEIVKKLKADTVSGDMVLKYLANESKISTTSGEISLEGVGGVLDAQTVSGDIDIMVKKLNGDWNIETTSGNVVLKLTEAMNAKINYESVSGELNDNTLENDFSKVESGKYNLKVNSISGDMLIDYEKAEKEQVMRNQKNNIDDTKDVKVVDNVLVLPMDKMAQRVSKKKFGMYITPQDSPVQPENFIGFHTGADLEIFPEELENDVIVKSICAGEIVYKDYASGYGGVVVQKCVLDNEAITVVYGHLRLGSVVGGVGSELARGETLGLLGKAYSEETSGERKHLHLGIHRGESINILGYVQNESQLSDWIDPCIYLCKE